MSKKNVLSKFKNAMQVKITGFFIEIKNVKKIVSIFPVIFLFIFISKPEKINVR